MSDRELCRFLRIARGSNQEVLSQMLLAESLGFMTPADWSELEREIERVGAMLTSMIRRMG